LRYQGGVASNPAPAVGLVGRRGDAQLLSLGRAIEARGGTAVPLDLSDIPAYVAFHWDERGMRFGELDLLTLQAVYARTAHSFVAPPTRNPEAQATDPFEARESSSLCNAILGELDCHLPMINPPGSHRYHTQKPLMYAALQRAGLPVPDYAVGCDLEQLACFVEKHQQEVVAKPLMGGEVVLADFDYLRTHHADVDKRPLLLQRRIVGRSLRGYVVAGVTVAVAEIEHGEVIDWRRDVRAIRPAAASADAVQAMAAATAALGLVFSSVDLEEEGGPGGRAWLLDVNPAPMFAVFEQSSGLDVSGPLADCLLQRARQGVPTTTSEGGLG
jgi:glutathione synthase/RimK-type ligase-like ATP-grasp enzyme